MTYKEKLKDERWDRKRRQILERDNFQCCGYNCPSPKETMLQVHHLDYLPGIEPWDYPNDMLITLCGHCHGGERYRQQVEKQLITVLKLKGFFLSDLLAFATYLHKDEQFTQTLLLTLRTFQNG